MEEIRRIFRRNNALGTIHYTKFYWGRGWANGGRRRGNVTNDEMLHWAMEQAAVLAG